MLFLLLVFRVLSLDVFQLSQGNVVFHVIGDTNFVQGNKGVFRAEIDNKVKRCFLYVKDEE